jgi:hypothetical protein
MTDIADDEPLKEDLIACIESEIAITNLTTRALIDALDHPAVKEYLPNKDERFFIVIEAMTEALDRQRRCEELQVQRSAAVARPKPPRRSGGSAH